jgi:hypothetical protein
MRTFREVLDCASWPPVSVLVDCPWGPTPVTVFENGKGAATAIYQAPRDARGIPDGCLVITTLDHGSPTNAIPD